MRALATGVAGHVPASDETRECADVDGRFCSPGTMRKLPGPGVLVLLGAAITALPIAHSGRVNKGTERPDTARERSRSVGECDRPVACSYIGALASSC